MKFRNIVLLFLGVFLFSLATFHLIITSYQYTNLIPNFGFLETKQFIAYSLHWRISFYIHVFTSSLLLICGAVQFIPFIIRKYTHIHRISGYIYSIVVLFFSGPSAFIMSYYANGGAAAQCSFLLVSTIWYLSTVYALVAVKQNKYMLHASFMLRSFLLSCSALTLRLYAMILSYLHTDIAPREKYILIAWLSWVPNLLIAEWVIQSGVLKALFPIQKESTTT